MPPKRAKLTLKKAKTDTGLRLKSEQTTGLLARATNLRTAEQALSHLRNGMRVFVGSGCAAPQKLVAALAAYGQKLFDVEIIHILTFGPAPYATRELLDHFRHNAF